MNPKKQNSIPPKKILLGITGSIALYKTIELLRLLQKENIELRVILTESAQSFITPLIFESLNIKVYTSLWQQGMDHILLAKWVDLFVIAPATANTMNKIANGIADNLLLNTVLATSAKIALVPAMNTWMYHAPATQRSLEILMKSPYMIWGPASGIQACGDTEEGRLLEPTIIKEHILKYFYKKKLANKKVIVTAGCTQENIDPVRFISNHSSGRMGFALARAASFLGAQTHLIAGPTELVTPLDVHREDILSSQDMQEKVNSLCCNDIDIFISCAAVSDYMPIQPSLKKIKKKSSSNSFLLELQYTPDILKSVSCNPHNRPKICIGFAAETHDFKKHAQLKLIEKKLDVIILNEISQKKGFYQDKNAVEIITPETSQILLLEKKETLAFKIYDFLFQQKII